VLVGITGHQKLGTRCAEIVRAELQGQLAAVEAPLVGLTSLAAGADQIFADAVLQAGGELNVVVPADQIEASFQDAAALMRFRQLLKRAHSVTRMPFDEPGEQAYWEAGRTIVERSDLLLAVWDGGPAGGLGGTADVVHYARARGTPVTVIWPDDCKRSA
jgi:hypothetical protein